MEEGFFVEINNQPTHIEYTREDGVHIMGLPTRPWEAIKNGTKKVEHRASTNNSNFEYGKILPGDTICIINEQTGDNLYCRVNQNIHYPGFEELVANEGLSNFSSKPETAEQAIALLKRLTEYEQTVPERGIYAIHITPLD